MIGNSWDLLLEAEYEKDYFKKLQDFVINEYKTKTIYPKISEIFKAFIETKYEDVKVVILGQDPYHGENQAEGLSFSVKVGIDKPKSLINIFAELKDDLGCKIPNNGSLVPWAKQGVLLLNSTLTVVKDNARSHAEKGWEIFTDEVIKIINKKNTPVVFILWGSDARSKKTLITNSKHYIIESAHPSPLSAYRGFFGSKPFSKTNNFLIKNKIKPIDWQIKDI
ncbi:MAG: uracil-DNA glycosylase [Bacilli bacterium]|nr:uracil-DNA glycosylase [Bacilli bacterium]